MKLLHLSEREIVIEGTFETIKVYQYPDGSISIESSGTKHHCYDHLDIKALYGVDKKKNDRKELRGEK